MTGPGRAGGETIEWSWWYEDPQRWHLLEFDGRHDSNGLPVDLLGQERQQVLETLARTTGRVNIDFARFLLTQETLRHGHCWSFNRSIEIAALLVAEHRHITDVWLLWQGTCRSFDTWCGIPHRLLYAAGVTPTLDYVLTTEHPQRDGLLAHLSELTDTTDDQVAALLADRRRHYRMLPPDRVSTTSEDVPS